MKGIELCADCAYYDRKHHSCKCGCTEEPDINKGEDVRFYVDCPLPEVQEEKHGKWNYYKNNGIVDIYKCSVCEMQFQMAMEVIPSSVFCYCPHCGAKMDKE